MDDIKTFKCLLKVLQLKRDDFINKFIYIKDTLTYYKFLWTSANMKHKNKMCQKIELFYNYWEMLICLIYKNELIFINCFQNYYYLFGKFPQLLKIPKYIENSLNEEQKKEINEKSENAIKYFNDISTNLILKFGSIYIK